MIVWLTGRPCSGKTTLAHSLNRFLKARAWKTALLDGDVIRPTLWPELTFTAEDREKNVLRFATLANMFVQEGVLPIVSVVSPNRGVRELVRKGALSDPLLNPPECFKDFIEVYVNAPYEVCAARDVKGMYAKALSGGLSDFTGVGSDYEPPLNPDVECHTDLETVAESTDKITFAMFNPKFEYLQKLRSQS
jgi:adenylylsulfate kinase